VRGHLDELEAAALDAEGASYNVLRGCNLPKLKVLGIGMLLPWAR